MTDTTLIVIATIAKTTFYIEFVALMYILLYYLSQASVKQQVMPISTIRHLGSIRQCISTFDSSQTQFCNCLVCFEIMNIRFCTYITYQHHLIHGQIYN